MEDVMSTLGRRSVLVIDDKKQWRSFFSDLLLDEYTVTCAQTYKEARALIETQEPPFHVVITDIILEDTQNEPDQLGLELLADAKAFLGYTSTVVITGYPSVATARKALRDLGACDYLAKEPLDPSEFQNVIRKAGERADKLREALVPPAKVFIVYAREDLDKAWKIWRRLREAGFNSWLDLEDLLPGEPRELRIENNIQNADFVIVCLSSAVHKPGFVHKQIEYALERQHEMPDADIYLIPVRLDDSKIPEKLEYLQHLDLHIDRDEDWQKLSATLKSKAKHDA
jgi:ActR/RegA family two-component response regulator